MVVLDLKARVSNNRPSERVTTQTAAGQTPSETINKDWSGAIEGVCALLESIQRRVLNGSAFQDLSSQLDDLKASFAHNGSGDTVLQTVARVETILDSYQNRLHQSQVETAVDFKRILDLVNESFAALQTGDDKSKERLKYLEGHLREATRINSLVSLRRHLSEMLDFVRQEGKLDLAERESRDQSMTERFQQAQLANARVQVQMPGRLDALNCMRAIADSATTAGTQVSLFVVDTLKALRPRHGEEIALSILEELGRKQIQPLAPEGKLFCWSASSLVLISRPKGDSYSAGLLSTVPAVFEHRAFTGTRVATFKVNVRSISTTLVGGLDAVVAALDRFSKETGS